MEPTPSDDVDAVDGPAPEVNEKVIAMRDSKDPKGVVLFFTLDQWTAFIRDIKEGRYD